MPNIQVISRTRHASQRWQRFASYAFAGRDAVAPLVAQELTRAVMTLPLGFIANNGQFKPVAVQGLHGGRNLFVAADGRWLGGYIPAAYRGYPFALVARPDGQKVLGVDEESGLLSGSAGEAFFDEAGQPSPAVKKVLEFLNRVEQNRQVTERLCAALQKHKLLQPWPIRVKSGSSEKNVEGLYRIDEAALNRLPAEAFEEIRQTGALPVAYCQLLSMQHLPRLGQLAQAHAQAEQQPSLPTTPAGELDLEFFSKGGTISFGNLI